MTKREAEALIAEIAAALQNEGPNPGAHRILRAQHAREWPTLHTALNKLQRAVETKP